MVVETWKQDSFTNSVASCVGEIKKIKQVALDNLDILASTARANQALSNTHLTVVLEEIEKTRNLIINKHERG